MSVSYALFFLLVVVHLLVGVRKQSRPVSLHAPWDCHYITRCLLLLNPAMTGECGLQKWWGHDAICNFASFQDSMLYAIEDRSCLAIAFLTLTGEESDLHWDNLLAVITNYELSTDNVIWVGPLGWFFYSKRRLSLDDLLSWVHPRGYVCCVNHNLDLALNLGSPKHILGMFLRQFHVYSWVHKPFNQPNALDSIKVTTLFKQHQFVLLAWHKIQMIYESSCCNVDSLITFN